MTIIIGLKPKATNFRECNLVGVIEIANDILEYIKKLQLPNEVAKHLCKDMLRTEDICCDEWMSLAWQMAYLELFERQIRVEDSQCESNGPDFNGGFNVPAPIAFRDMVLDPGMSG